MIKKVTIICENSIEIPFPVIGEHGLSFYIEGDDGITIFDTGQGLGFMNNMKLLGKNIPSINRVILSHGHYDHTGGLLSLLKEREAATPVFVHPAAFIEKGALLPSGDVRSIGFPASREDYEKEGADFKEISGFTKVTDSISAISDIKHPEGWKAWDTRLMRKSGDGVIPDPFEDDLSLIIETPSGPVVLLGCAHAGIIEILDSISEETGHKKFHAVIGGTHLDSAPEDYVVKTIEVLKKYNVEKIAASHCTGLRIAARLAGEFGEKFINASVGKTFEF
ncbi:MAG TPA: MBL fold metallo-hydrolase [Spirochaetota bacterium]|nr:MBL fold metallo-hydrolase [Spirochaetota bacterium]HPJ34931.1 MBL fold metallo-hydrolase [Spirochaetota bacterium]